MNINPPKKNRRSNPYREYSPWNSRSSRNNRQEPIWKSYTPPNRKDMLFRKRQKCLEILSEIDDEIESDYDRDQEINQEFEKYYYESSQTPYRTPRRSKSLSEFINEESDYTHDYHRKKIGFQSFKPNNDPTKKRCCKDDITPVSTIRFGNRDEEERDIFPFRSTKIKPPSRKSLPNSESILENLEEKKSHLGEDREDVKQLDSSLDKQEKQDLQDKQDKQEKQDTTTHDPFFLFSSDQQLKKPEKGSGLLQLLIQGSQIKEGESKDDLERIEQFQKKLKERSKCLQGKQISDCINTLDDLIKLSDKIGDLYDEQETYVLDLSALKIMTPSLRKLRNMIGLEDIKTQIVQQVLFYLQGLDELNKDMLHTVIEGNPGVGKTEIAKILGEIYGALGILSKGTFHSVKRADLVGGYLGQTASKTLSVLEKAKGGVLFIDEAYSLGNAEGKDMYSKECIDTITAYLSENREDFVCIIAGYKESLKQCFFKYNHGLERRFPWKYTIKKYSDEELKLIFEKIVQDHNWKSNIDLEFFQNHQEKFKNSGGDLENLFQKAKLAHAKRCLSIPFSEKKIITMEDLKNGLDMFLEEVEEKNTAYAFMYN